MSNLFDEIGRGVVNTLASLIGPLIVINERPRTTVFNYTNEVAGGNSKGAIYEGAIDDAEIDPNPNPNPEEDNEHTFAQQHNKSPSNKSVGRSL